ncbi:MAG: hypothetical protein AAGJ87_06000 [Pseudomonadota bacterium]
MEDEDETIELQIDDDSGLLALVVSSEYRSFVSEDWTYEQVLDHFAAQMQARNILVWGCGDGGNLYRVQVAAGFTSIEGYRNATGVINPVNGRLHLASYTALTMAAQFADYHIPSDDEATLAFSLPAAMTRIRVIQMYDPAATDAGSMSGPHFRIEHEPGDAEAWTEAAWESNRAPRVPHDGDRPGAVSRILKGLFSGRR